MSWKAVFPERPHPELSGYGLEESFPTSSGETSLVCDSAGPQPCVEQMNAHTGTCDHAQCWVWNVSSRYSEGHVQAGHASLGETDVCDVHREDRRGKLHRVHLQTLRVSFQGGAESVSVDPEFSSDLVIARDDTVTQQWLHFPSCPAPVSPSHQSHRAVEGCVCLCSFFAHSLQKCIVLSSGGTAGS